MPRGGASRNDAHLLGMPLDESTSGFSLFLMSLPLGPASPAPLPSVSPTRAAALALGVVAALMRFRGSSSSESDDELSSESCSSTASASCSAWTSRLARRFAWLTILKSVRACGAGGQARSMSAAGAGAQRVSREQQPRQKGSEGRQAELPEQIAQPNVVFAQDDRPRLYLSDTHSPHCHQHISGSIQQQPGAPACHFGIFT